MTTLLSSQIVTPVLGFILGFAFARANSCTVASTRRLVIDHRPDWLFGLMIAISWAGVVLLGFAAIGAERFRLPAALPLGWDLVVGSMMIGIGALINRGCFMGSVALLGRGNLNYLLTLAGIGLALAVSGIGSPAHCRHFHPRSRAPQPLRRGRS